MSYLDITVLTCVNHVKPQPDQLRCPTWSLHAFSKLTELHLSDASDICENQAGYFSVWYQWCQTTQRVRNEPGQVWWELQSLPSSTNPGKCATGDLSALWLDTRGKDIEIYLYNKHVLYIFVFCFWSISHPLRVIYLEYQAHVVKRRTSIQQAYILLRDLMVKKDSCKDERHLGAT